MSRRILLVGNGAREHIIAKAIMRSEDADDVELYVVGKAVNPGLKELAKDYLVGDICDKELIVKFAEKHNIFVACVGPEAPLEAGVIDALEVNGFVCFSPLRKYAQLEFSKGFTRDLMEKYGIEGNPKFKVFTSEEGVKEFLEELGEDFVVKYDGLKGGKGVKVSGDHLEGIEEGLAYALECIEEGGRVVIEEKLVGQEFSLMSFCDGKNTIDMPAVQDHKRAYDGDKGPNTGGMGTYSDADGSLPFLKKEDIEAASEMTKKVVAALYKECNAETEGYHAGLRGVMFGGFMATKGGVKLIEYNTRFGDPEAMNALTVLESSFLDICFGIINQKLDKVKVSFEKKATVCKYVVPEGYPENPCKGEKIEIGELPEGVEVFYSSVDEREDGLYLSGSRAVAFVAKADSLEEAEKLASEAVKKVKGPVFYRNDIGTAEVIEKKVKMMKELRGA